MRDEKYIVIPEQNFKTLKKFMEDNGIEYRTGSLFKSKEEAYFYLAGALNGLVYAHFINEELL